jgi:hypothetical protein
MTDDEIAFLMVIGVALFALGFSFGFVGGYITRSAKSHRRPVRLRHKGVVTAAPLLAGGGHFLRVGAFSRAAACSSRVSPFQRRAGRRNGPVSKVSMERGSASQRASVPTRNDDSDRARAAY